MIELLGLFRSCSRGLCISMGSNGSCMKVHAAAYAVCEDGKVLLE